MIWQGIQSLISFFSEMFKTFRKPEAVREKIAEEKAPLREQKARKKFFNRSWKFAKRKEKIERKAERKKLDDELKTELEKGITKN